MRFNINIWTVSARVSRDPELRYTPNGTAVTRFSIPVDFGEMVEGKWENRTMWWNVVTFGKLAEDIGNKVVKGSKVIVSGEVRIRTYTNKDGIEKESKEIHASHVILLDKQTKSEDAGATETSEGESADPF